MKGASKFSAVAKPVDSKQRKHPISQNTYSNTSHETVLTIETTEDMSPDD